MPIASSTMSVGPPQIDGRSFVTERHVDHLGAAYLYEYLDSGLTNRALTLSARASSLLLQLRDRDCDNAIFGSDWNYTLNHATLAELVAFARLTYKNSSKGELALIATRMLAWINNGRFTDLQMRSAFSLTATQWTALKTKLQTLANNHAAIELAVGE